VPVVVELSTEQTGEPNNTNFDINNNETREQNIDYNSENNFNLGEQTNENGSGDDGNNNNNRRNGNNNDSANNYNPINETDNMNNLFTRPCGSNRGCNLCTIIDDSQNIVSTITKSKISTVNQDGRPFYDCNSGNLIYLLTCNHCSLQYIGQTARKLRSRINEHLYSINKGKGTCPFLIKHFSSSSPCHNKGFRVNVLQKLVGSGLTDRGAVDKSKVSDRKDIENGWILKMRTVFPYGLNHDFGQDLSKGDSVIGINFPKILFKKRAPTRSCRPQNNNFVLADKLNWIEDIIINDIKNAPNIFRVFISGLKKCHLKSL